MYTYGFPAFHERSGPLAAPGLHYPPLCLQWVGAEGPWVGGSVLLSQFPPFPLTPWPGVWGSGSFIIVPCCLFFFFFSQNIFLWAFDAITS